MTHSFMNIKRFLYFSIVVVALLINACSENVTEPEPSKSRGSIISSTLLHTYTKTEIKQLLSYTGIPSTLDFKYSVAIVKIIYWTVDASGNEIKASGAVMYPAGESNLPIFNMNHGTVVKRDNVASVTPSSIAEGIAGITMGSLGYFSCVPDYPGYGVSDMLHPYIHAKSISYAVIDFIRAAKKYSKKKNIILNNQLFLAGYSEGGYVTLATQKEMEENYSDEFSITAVAPMAGPYNLLETATNLIQKTRYNNPAYIGFLLTAYNNIYEWNRLNDFFVQPYDNMMLSLFDGTQTLREVNSQLPKTLSKLLNQNFITNFLNGNDTQVVNTFEANSLLNWNPIAPLKFYHGDSDNVVPYQIAVSTVDNLKSRTSSSVELITIEGGTHATSILPSVISMVEWFESFR